MPILTGYAQAERRGQGRSTPIVPVGAGAEQEGESCDLAEEQVGLPRPICRIKAKPLKTHHFSIEIHFCRKTFICCVDSGKGLLL